MQVYVQNCKTHEYLGKDGNWTPRLNQALPFPTSADAVLHCTKADIDHAQVLLRFPREDLNLILPVDDDCRPPGS